MSQNIKLKKQLPSGKVRTKFEEIMKRLHVVLSIWQIRESYTLSKTFKCYGVC